MWEYSRVCVGEGGGQAKQSHAGHLLCAVMSPFKRPHAAYICFYELHHHIMCYKRTVAQWETNNGQVFVDCLDWMSYLHVYVYKYTADAPQYTPTNLLWKWVLLFFYRNIMNEKWHSRQISIYIFFTQRKPWLNSLTSSAYPAYATNSMEKSWVAQSHGIMQEPGFPCNASTIRLL